LLLDQINFCKTIEFNSILFLGVIALAITIVGCSSFFKQEQAYSAVNVLASSDHFYLVDIAGVTDGSVIFSFLNEDGQILHLWEDSIGWKGQDRRYYLKIRYNDPVAVEISHNSSLEGQVLKMLEECSRLRDSFPPVPHTFDSILDDLGMHLRNRHRRESIPKPPAPLPPR
jgi:hypothetical protein